MSLLPQSKNINCKVLIKQKKRIKKSSKRITNRSISNIYVDNIHLNPTKSLFQNQQDLIYTELFSFGFNETRKRQNKRGKV